MKKIVIIAIILSLFILPIVSAEDVVFSVDQKEYYFLTGQNAIIPLTMNNTFEKEINGRLTYTITQIMNQGGSQYSSSNSQTQSFAVPVGNNTIQINFGKSNQPMEVEADLEFSFTENDDTHLVSLNDIIIYFVSNQSQMNNQQNPMQSSSEKITNAEPSENNQQQPQTPQEQLQNNQMNQDSQALKNQIDQKMAEQQAQKQAFEENLFNNPDFQKQHQSLQNQGYNISEKQMDVESNSTGSFNFTYENQDGKKATFKGKMEDGKLTDFQKQTAEDRQELFETLNQSKEFQRYHQQLQNESYNQTSVNYDQQGNTTTMQVTYENNENETATITAEFLDQQLKEVTLSKEDDLHPLLWITPVLIVSGLILVFFYYKYFYKSKESLGTGKHVLKKPFDYKKEAARLLSQAEKYYEQRRYKKAYGKAGQSLRLFLSYEHGLKKEITNDDILRFLSDKQYPYDEIKRCFTLCSLVEFAKYKTSKTDFNQVYATVRSIIAQS